MPKHEFAIHFGALAPKMEEQLAGYGLDDTSIHKFQEDATALVRCHLRGILTDSEVKKARNRLYKIIKQQILTTPTTPT